MSGAKKHYGLTALSNLNIKGMIRRLGEQGTIDAIEAMISHRAESDEEFVMSALEDFLTP